MSSDSLSLEFYNHIPPKYEGILLKGISEYASEKKSLSTVESFGIFIKNKEAAVVGGISGVTFYGSLYIDSLWIDKQMRNQGLGKKLVEEAEKIGRKHGASFVTLSTMDWGAYFLYKTWVFYRICSRRLRQRLQTVYAEKITVKNICLFLDIIFHPKAVLACGY